MTSVAVHRAARLDDALLDALAAILLDCVQGGASVGFRASLTHAEARACWERVAPRVAAGETILLVAADAQGPCGTVSLVPAVMPNQPHRADVAKMLVHARARRAGVGAALLRAVEDAARAEGRTLLVLDTVTGSAASRLYERHGWTRVGDIPAYALMPDGSPCATTMYYRRLPP